MKPTLGRVVIYKSRIDNGPGNDVLSPALVIRTRDTTVAAVVNRWGPAVIGSGADPEENLFRPEGFVADLPDDDTVDLIVFGLGKTYREYAVPLGEGRGEWSWPPRV